MRPSGNALPFAEPTLDRGAKTTTKGHPAGLRMLVGEEKSLKKVHRTVR